MTRFEFFESGMGLAAARIGIISIGVLIKYDAYKTYREFIESGIKKSLAIVKTAEKCSCDQSTVARYIYWFERDDEALQKPAKNQPDQMHTFVSK